MTSPGCALLSPPTDVLSSRQVSENLQRNLRQEQGLQLELSTTFFSQVASAHIMRRHVQSHEKTRRTS